MSLAYLPIWCDNDNCFNCTPIKCQSKILELFEPYLYPDVDFSTRPKSIEITSIAIYFGYCKRLAKYFLRYPQYSPIPVVFSNFINHITRLPTSVSIQRILLDLLNISGPNAPTNDVHKYRLIQIQDTMRESQIGIHMGDFRLILHVTEEEKQKFFNDLNQWTQSLFSGDLVFEKTDDKRLCEYCILSDCDNI